MRTTHKEAKEEEEENRRRIDRGYSAMCILNLEAITFCMIALTMQPLLVACIHTKEKYFRK